MKAAIRTFAPAIAVMALVAGLPVHAGARSMYRCRNGALVLSPRLCAGAKSRSRVSNHKRIKSRRRVKIITRSSKLPAIQLKRGQRLMRGNKLSDHNRFNRKNANAKNASKRPAVTRHVPSSIFGVGHIRLPRKPNGKTVSKLPAVTPHRPSSVIGIGHGRHPRQNALSSHRHPAAKRPKPAVVFGVGRVRRPVAPCLRLKPTTVSLLAGQSFRFTMPVQAKARVRLSSNATPEGAIGRRGRHGISALVPPRAREFGRGGRSELLLDISAGTGVGPGVYTLRLPYKVLGHTTARCHAARALTLRLHIAEPRHMAAPELNRVGKKLTKNKPQTYRYIEIRGTQAGGHFRASYLIARTLHGLFLMRDPKSLKPLGSGIYGDGQGNRVTFGRLSKSRTSYELTRFAGGSTMLGADFNRNGVIDLAFSQVNVGGFSKVVVIVNSVAGSHFGFGPCGKSGKDWTSHIHNSTDDSTSGGGKTSQSYPCLPSFGGGGSGGGSALNTPLTGKPDCSPSPGNLSEVSESHHDTVAESQELDVLILEDKQLKDDLQTIIKDEEIERNDVANHAPKKQIDADDDATNQAYDRFNSRLRQINSQSNTNSSSGSGSQPSSSNNQGNGRSGTNSQPGYSEGNPGGSSSDVKDPRCPHGKAQMEQAYCLGSNMLQCLEKAQDPLSEKTGGVCLKAPGPADASTIKCKPNKKLASGVFTGSPGGSTAGVNDMPGTGLNTHRNIDKTLISTLPLGGAMAALCHADCGNWGAENP